MEKELFFERYRHIFALNGLDAYTSEETMDKMHAMVAHMLEVNAHTNLTAITDWEEIIVKHLADCCAVLPYLPQGIRVLDVGCGGGFPSLPIAIARPDLTVLGLDSTGKKVDYVNESAKLLALGNLSAICGRAEDLAKTELRESFDAVVSRAVANFPVLCELCAPFVRVGGLFCAMKGANADLEAALASNAREKLGLSTKNEDANQFSLIFPNEQTEERTIFVMKKERHTPAKYPRAYAQIKKSPL